ncbi:MAG: glycine cleavage system aminomethyltransferase GcvT [Candidatus Sumerlaeia bacterium]|nr:glycine cleavage system aminomethyltransferase GcvT [Candidatus Sumerlaeia bacterium]
MGEAAAANLLRTPLHGQHVALGARMTPFGGWDMPLSYEGQLAEHDAVRGRVGMFDVSHMGQVRLRGERAAAFLDQLTPGKIGRLSEDGRSVYTQLCADDGGMLDDLIISRLGPAEFFAVVNASTREGDVRWMRAAAERLGYHDVSIGDESAHWAMIAVQGPAAFDVLSVVLPGRANWAATPSFTVHPFVYRGQAHLLSRTGYTGEVGGELLCPAELADHWWERFLAAGVAPCGLAARDSLRLEAGYCLYGNDCDPSVSPVEAGLSWSVDWAKPVEFLGRARLHREKAEGAARLLAGLRTGGRRPLRHGEDVLDAAGAPVGVVTSGGYSPGLQAGIALASVAPANAVPGMELGVKTRGGVVPAQVVRPPFVATSLSKK